MHSVEFTADSGGAPRQNRNQFRPLAIRPARAYALAMRDPLHSTHAELEADLAVSEAEIARGETVPLAPVLEELRQSIARMEARQEGRTAQALKA